LSALTRQLAKLGIIAFVYAVALACKAPGAGSESSGVSSAGPQRVASASSDSPGRKIGQFGAGGGTRIMVDMSMPRTAGDGAASCWPEIPQSAAIGRAVCLDDARLTSEYTAAAVDFMCGADPSHGAIRARRPLSLKDCGSWAVYVYDFDPPLAARIAD
jgi:hypothetical protein